MREIMLKILLCDDEDIVRVGLKQLIDWSDHGWEICGEAANGNEALSLIRSLKPDLVLLDIKMPGINGIEILKICNQDVWQPRFLILSGYTDFEFAKDAINYGAIGYLLKPIDEDLLAEKVDEVAQLIQKESEVRKQLGAITQLVRQEQFLQLFQGNLDINTKKNLMENQEFDQDFQVLIFSVELCGYMDRLKYFEKMINDFFSFLQHETVMQNNNLIIIFRNEKELVIERYIEQFYRRLNYHGKQKDKDHELQLGAIASLGNRYHGIQGLLDSYKEAFSLLSRLFFETGNTFVSMHTFTPFNSQQGFSETISFHTEELLSYIEIYDLRKITDFFQQLQGSLYNSTMNQIDIKRYCVSFIVELRTLLFTKHPEKELWSNPANDLINVILGSRYLVEIIGALHEYVNGLAETLVNDAPNNTILKLIQYVRNNYNLDLKLENLGQLFNCNSTYLGKRFKEQTGECFNSYLDRLRIEAAKKMLKTTDLRIYQISELVGYSSVDYFYSKFRKYEHITPRKYRVGID